MQKIVLLILFLIPSFTFSQIIWSDDFSDPNTWVIDHDDNTCNLDWSIGSNLSNQGDFAIDNIYSTTAYNGFAMLDSDYYGQVNGGDELENSWITTSSPIDLSDVSNAILEFESYYYRWIYEECFVVISTNNNDWPVLSPEFEADSNPNVFLVWSDIELQDLVNNPTTIQLDISEIAGEQSQVWIRFNWTGSYGYSWFIDDVNIYEQVADDVKMESGIVNHVNSSIYYPRFPFDQFNDQLYFSSYCKNIGYDTLSNVKITLELSDLNNDPIYQDTSINYSFLNPGASFSYTTNNDTLYLSEGIYNSLFMVTADEEQDGVQFENNSILSKFAITNDLYSIDGIGVFNQSNTLPIGTNSFIDAEDESYLMSQYTLTKDTTNVVYGLEVLLSPNTIAGGTLIGHLFYASDVLNEIVSESLLSTEELIITQDHIDNGWLRIYFETIDSLDADDYMAGIEMYSNNNDNTISILNDVSYAQDNEASVMIIDGQLNTSPNAAAIRLLMSPENPTKINKIEKEIVLFQNIPNPANQHTRIEFSLLKKEEVNLKVIDSYGRLIYAQRLGVLTNGKHQVDLDLSDYSSGVYYYSIQTRTAVYSKQLLIIK